MITNECHYITESLTSPNPTPRTTWTTVCSMMTTTTAKSGASPPFPEGRSTSAVRPTASGGKMERGLRFVPKNRDAYSNLMAPSSAFPLELRQTFISAVSFISRGRGNAQPCGECGGGMRRIMTYGDFCKTHHLLVCFMNG